MNKFDRMEALVDELFRVAASAGYGVFVARLKLNPLGGSCAMGGAESPEQDRRLLEFVEEQVAHIRGQL